MTWYRDREGYTVETTTTITTATRRFWKPEYGPEPRRQRQQFPTVPTARGYDAGYDQRQGQQDGNNQQGLSRGNRWQGLLPVRNELPRSNRGIMPTTQNTVPRSVQIPAQSHPIVDAGGQAAPEGQQQESRHVARAIDASHTRGDEAPELAANSVRSTTDAVPGSIGRKQASLKVDHQLRGVDMTRRRPQAPGSTACTIREKRSRSRGEDDDPPGPVHNRSRIDG